MATDKRESPPWKPLEFCTQIQFDSISLRLGSTYVLVGQKIYGRVFEGAWERGVKHGEGVLHTGTGQVYEGCFKDDQYHGQGVLRGPGKTVLDGEWKRGKLNGENSKAAFHGIIFITSFMSVSTSSHTRLFDGLSRVRR